MISDAPVVVVGAGIGGLTSACALQQAHIPVRVLEHRTTVRGLGAGITLWPNALAVLDRLGLADAVRSTGVALDGGALRRADGALLRDVGRLTAVLGESAICVRRDALIEILQAHVAPHTVRLGSLVTGFRTAPKDNGQNVETSIEAVIEGARGVTGRVLVGADGIGSAVARQLHPDWRVRASGTTAWRGVASVRPTSDGRRPLQALESWGVEAEFGALPLTETSTYWFATAKLPPGCHESSPAEELVLVRRRFADWHAPIPELLAATDSSSVLRHDLEDRPPRCWWGQGAVTLLGDAAHPVRPHLGQGACLAIEDAWELASCLVSHDQPTTALQEYERRRRRRATMIWAQSGLLGELIHARSPLLQWVRDISAQRMPLWQQHLGLRMVAAPR